MCDSTVTCTAGTVGVWAALCPRSQPAEACECVKHPRSETATASNDQYPVVDEMWIGQISLEKEEAVGSSICEGVDVPDDF